MTAPANPYFPTHRKIPGARFQLICLPYAGGGAMMYKSWETKLGPGIEVGAVELPGRGRRFTEKPFDRLDTVLPPLTQAIGSFLDGRPFAIFGHSMGALLAFEVAHRLHRAGAKLPAVLFLSARGTHDRDDNIHALPEDLFIARLRSYSGTPTEILDHPEMMELFLPLLRADFAVATGSRDQETTSAIPVPLEVLGGSADPHVSVESLSGWAVRTTSQFRSTVFTGGHFYQREQEDAVLRLITNRLTASGLSG